MEEGGPDSLAVPAGESRQQGWVRPREPRPFLARRGEMPSSLVDLPLVPEDGCIRSVRPRKEEDCPGVVGAVSPSDRVWLTEADLRAAHPDPGSVEPVRQGLMTLHTLSGTGTAAQDDRYGGE